MSWPFVPNKAFLGDKRTFSPLAIGIGMGIVFGGAGPATIYADYTILDGGTAASSNTDVADGLTAATRPTEQADGGTSV